MTWSFMFYFEAIMFWSIWHHPSLVPCQDARKQKMALRYNSCSEKTMQTFQGFLGVFDQAAHQDLTAVGCRDATLGVLQDLCSPQSAPPEKKEPWWHDLTVYFWKIPSFPKMAPKFLRHLRPNMSLYCLSKQSKFDDLYEVPAGHHSHC